MSRQDPTRTLTLRRRYANAMSSRMGLVKERIVEAVVDHDAFRLAPSVEQVSLQVFEGSDAERVAAFIAWLDAVQADIVLEDGSGEDLALLGIVTALAWQREFVAAAYAAGLVQADVKLRKIGVSTEIRVPGPTPLATPIVISDPRTSLVSPTHSRVIDLELQLNRQELTRILLEGSRRAGRAVIEGLRAGLPARALSDVIIVAYEESIRRARALAAERIVGAHAEATLSRFSEFGIEYVSGLAEFVTADDEDVCPRCRALEGKLFPVAEAHGIIPVHPWCRCAWLPAVKEGAIAA